MVNTDYLFFQKCNIFTSICFRQNCFVRNQAIYAGAVAGSGQPGAKEQLLV